MQSLFKPTLLSIIQFMLLASLLLMCGCKKQILPNASMQEKRDGHQLPTTQTVLRQSVSMLLPNEKENPAESSNPDEPDDTNLQTPPKSLYQVLSEAINKIGKGEQIDAINEPMPDIPGNQLNLLQAAVYLDQKVYVEKLLQAGADANKQDEEQRTVLHIAVDNGYQAVIAVLLGLGMCKNLAIDHQGHSGKTALHIAADKGNADIVNALVDKKANKALLDQAGNKAINLAKVQYKTLLATNKNAVALKDYEAIIKKLGGFRGKMADAGKKVSKNFQELKETFSPSTSPNKDGKALEKTKTSAPSSKLKRSWSSKLFNKTGAKKN